MIEAIIKLAERAAKEPRELKPKDDGTKIESVLGVAEAELRAGLQESPSSRSATTAVDAVKAKVDRRAVPADAEATLRRREGRRRAFKELRRRRRPLRASSTPEARIDGRDLKTVRPIVCEVGILPRTHGSALFTRGETQALVVATLGTGEDEQYVDALQGTYKETFLLHYNFPPYSVGEVGRMGSPGRREIGHGKLAWRAIHPMLPATRRASPTPSASCRRSPSRTARRRWRPCAERRWR